jgi:hypothetical protein
LIEKIAGTAQALASLPDGRIVAAQQGRLLATSFHPELTPDDRFHRYFLLLSKQSAPQSAQQVAKQSGQQSAQQSAEQPSHQAAGSG